ncbi:MAG: DUF531 domain-containing protein [Archaeoglobaceae archaeon]|nr:DUF531 domain-containing protein [Archaeoglobaceae archaeon]MCX8151830.1 DUF531 domain-containing protein [Archaeoglobaceae archaeon]MDW8014338.1 DUF531 family protein [Archaeoglobaceae archaeon]
MIVLCLVNTYDKVNLKEAHLRAIARASALCYAFDFHLALLDFPFWKNVEEVVEEVANYTTIGDGNYVKELEKVKRLHIIEKIPAHFGKIIATTSKPDEKKKLKFEEISKIRTATFLIGLGRKGLPRELMDLAEFHLDVTMKGISLETCTAMGAIAMLIAMVRGWKK